MNIQNSNIVTNMSLEGFELDNNDINRLEQLSNPNLSKLEIKNMIKKMKLDIIRTTCF
jgi:hypothetical protein